MAKTAHIATPWPEETMKQYKWLDTLLQKQPATEKDFKPAWQAYRYTLRGKMYAFIGVNDQNGRPIITLKLDPGYSELLRRTYAGIVPGYYMNKYHWSTAYLDSEVPREVLADMVLSSHKQMLSACSKKAQREILHAGN